MRRIGINEARPILGDLIDAARDGEDVIFTRHGKPAARLTRYQEDSMDIADLTRFLGLPDDQQEAVYSWTGETDRTKRWTEQEAAELAEIWNADKSGETALT